MPTINPNTFRQNVEWNIDQIAVQVGHAENVRSRARSGYYKAAVIVAASVVEALAYRLLDQNKTLEMPLEDWECFSSHSLPESHRSTDGFKFSICKRRQPRFELLKHTDFKKVNEVCLKLNLFTKKFFNKIERIRKLRNKIHIQGLDNIDRSYTKKQLEYISSVMNELLGKINLN